MPRDVTFFSCLGLDKLPVNGVIPGITACCGDTEREKTESLPSRMEYSSWEDKTDIFSEMIRLK